MTRYSELAKNDNHTIELSESLQNVVSLYNGLIRCLEKTKIAMQNKDVVQKCKAIQNAVEIIEALHSGLDFRNNNNLVVILDRYYTTLLIKTNMFLLKEKKEQDVDILLDDVSAIRNKWNEFLTSSDYEVSAAVLSNSKMNFRC